MSQEYQRLLQDMWWQEVATERPSVSKLDRLVWLLDTAMIIRLEEGSMQVEDLMAQYHEYESQFAGAGFKLTKQQLEDVYNGMPGGEALELAGAWSRQIGFQSAYWPQHEVAKAIREGGAAGSLTYDGLPFFSTGHFVNGVNNEDGTFSNIITAAVLNAAGLGSAAPSIHEFGTGAVTADVALQNIQRCKAYIASIKMPNGRDPRKLRARGILVPPAISGRAQQITNAKFIAQAAASGGGGAVRATRGGRGCCARGLGLGGGGALRTRSTGRERCSASASGASVSWFTSTVPPKTSTMPSTANSAPRAW